MLTLVMTVFRGASGLAMPPKLKVPSKLGSRLGIEYGFMSTTTDKAVAVKYGRDAAAGNAAAWDAAAGNAAA